MTITGFTRRLTCHIARANATLYPGYFAMVMATGIVSTALYFLGFKESSQALFWVNLVVYPWLIAATLIRAARFGTKLWADLTSPETVFLFFTFVAASNVLGVQFLLRGQKTFALSLWIIACIAWLFMSYFSFSALTFANTRPLAETVNASWLVAVVGTQSVTVLGALLAPGLGVFAQPLLLAMYGLWGIGIVLYVTFITLIFSRLFFAHFSPGEMLPPYWIILGATAISALAGANLCAVASKSPFLVRIQPLLEGVTVLLWAWSSWWIPMLVIFGLWRHIVRKTPLSYHPGYWSLVFPLGMYTVATYRISVVMKLSSLEGIPPVMVWVALIAWVITMLGLGKSLMRGVAQVANFESVTPLQSEVKA